jgi:hypothetical protein
MANGNRLVTIPRHDPVNSNTMAVIVRDAGMTPEKFRSLLRSTSGKIRRHLHATRANHSCEPYRPRRVFLRDRCVAIRPYRRSRFIPATSASRRAPARRGRRPLISNTKLQNEPRRNLAARSSNSNNLRQFSGSSGQFHRHRPALPSPPAHAPPRLIPPPVISRPSSRAQRGICFFLMD